MLGLSMTATPHDALFKTTFSRLEHAEQLLRALLPKALVDRMDFSTLRLCPGSFVDEALVDRHTDLLFSVEIAGRRALIYVLCEHSSYVDPRIGFRLLAYMVRIWEALVKDHPNATKLPAIVPLVIHHSETGWTASTEFEELLDLDAEALSVVAAYVPRFRFLLDDISAVSDESIHSRAMGAMARLVLFCLKHARASETLIERLQLFVDLVNELRRTRRGAAALNAVWMYILRVSRHKPSTEVLAQLKSVVGEEVAEDIMNVAEQLIQEGVQRGLEKGLEKGLAKQRTLLLKLLNARVGAPPDDVVARVMSADEAELDQWTDRALTALTLAEVFDAEHGNVEGA
jgi:predicted transposase YdaD